MFKLNPELHCMDCLKKTNEYSMVVCTECEGRTDVDEENEFQNMRRFNQAIAGKIKDSLLKSLELTEFKSVHTFCKSKEELEKYCDDLCIRIEEDMVIMNEILSFYDLHSHLDDSGE